MKKAIILIIIVIYFTQIGFAIEECKGTITPEESPCYILLPVNQTTTLCSGITARFYNETNNLYNQTMSSYTDFLCNSTFNRTKLGTYTIYYTTDDSASIIIQEGESMDTALSIFFGGLGISLIGIGVYILLRRVSNGS